MLPDHERRLEEIFNAARGLPPPQRTFQLVLVGLVLLLTGCETVEQYSLTYRLWDNEDLSKFSEPAPNPNLALTPFAVAGDTVMVCGVGAVVGFFLRLEMGAPH